MDKILHFERDGADKIDWEELLDQKSSFKLLYSLCVMEFLMENNKADTADEDEPDMEEQI